MSEVETELFETQQKFSSIMKEESKTQSNSNSKFDHNADFLSFDDAKDASKHKKDPKAKLNRAEHYPWLTDKTLESMEKMESKDMHVYLHNEIVDFV